MDIRDGFVGAVGATPLIRLHRMSAETGCEILGKAEFMNPGGSVKDRAAKWIVLDAERRGALKPGGTVVEGTAGNTGIGLAHVCKARGYRCVIVMPDNQSAEKYQIIETLGAEFRKVPAVPYSNPNQYQKVAARAAQEIPGAVGRTNSTIPLIAMRISNPRVPRSGATRTARSTRFARPPAPAARWPGSRDFSNRSPRRCASCSWIRRVAPCTSYIQDGELKSDGGSSITEGIGTGRVTANLAGAPIDDAMRIDDAETVRFVYRLLREEGLLLGSTAGINVAAAVRLARQLGPGHTIVTMLCDGGAKYQSRLFNPAWIAEHGFGPAIG